jgi:conjugative transfer signal peptidase TraF
MLLRTWWNVDEPRARSFRLLPAMLGSSASLALVGTLLWRPQPLLIWNASSSSPLGFYTVARARRVIVGDLIVAWAPPAARRLAARRNYLPTNVPLIKRVAAVQGDIVCAKRSLVLINGHVASLRRSSDRRGRPLPWWNGCKVLAKGELFLLSSHARFAFDGRYFGMTQPQEVIGKARLIWSS